MSLELWIAFTVASLIILAIPGPTVMLVVSYALGQGRGSGLATVPGVTLGDFTAMTLSLAGAGALLAASATLFTVMKLLGAAYLVWLGIGLWRAKPEDVGEQEMASADPAKGRHTMFWNAYIVTALNPKSIVFFVAFLPQFLNVQDPLLPQFAVMEATFLSLAAANVALWVALAGQFHGFFRKSAARRLLNRIGGTFLIAAGILTALTRRSA